MEPSNTARRDAGEQATTLTLGLVPDADGPGTRPATEESWLANATHDLLSPLAIVETAAETLRYHRDRLSPDQVDEILDRIGRAASRARRLVGDMLEVDGGETEGMFDADLEPVDLLAFAREIVEDMSLDGSDRIRLEGVPVTAVLDRRHARRMLDNLIGNAAKYSPQGAPIVVRVADAYGAAVCSVDDAGPGIAPEDRVVIWGAFERLPDAHTVAPGSGLGLHAVATLASLQGASVAVDDAPEGGASFRVAFRKARARNVRGG